MLLGLLAFCHAQVKITLQFESAAPREVFVASELPKSAPSQTSKAAETTYDYNLPAFGSTDRIYVWDHATNNIASKAIKEIANNLWTVKASDFTTVGNLTVHIEHKGLPVAAAKVSVGSKGKSDEKLLDPSAKGDVQFFGFPVGELRVKVTYNTLDKKEGNQEQIFPVESKRDKAEPTFAIAIPDDVATIAEAAPATGAPGAGQNLPQGNGQAKPAGQAPEQGGKNGVATLVIMLLVIGLLVGGAYWFFNFVKNKPKQFEETLQKLGVQIPQQQDPDNYAPVAVTPLAPAPPPPKIMLDGAEPTPLGTVAAVASPVLSSGEPTLVGESGQRLTLAEGETSVGREEGLGLSLVGESTVSRRHASVTRTGNTAVVKDLGSTNGTFVNGTRLQGEATLKPGDQVQFGSVRFRYEG